MMDDRSLDYQEGYADAKAEGDALARAVGEKLGWLLFNHGKGKPDAVRNLAIGALRVIDEMRGTDYATIWEHGLRPPTPDEATCARIHHPLCPDHDHEGECDITNERGGYD